MSNLYNPENNTNFLFHKLNILTLEQLYIKASVLKIYMNKVDFEPYKTRGMSNGNLEFKPNTSLMGNYYINRGRYKVNYSSTYRCQIDLQRR